MAALTDNERKEYEHTIACLRSRVAELEASMREVANNLGTSMLALRRSLPSKVPPPF